MSRTGEPDATAAAPRLQHRLRRMTGRSTTEAHRASTPLELLFDLTFVVGFGQIADQTARVVSEGHVLAALGGFAFGMFAVCWAWVNFSWFSSAFDTDDWFFRIATMVQMVGVLILALGLPAMFTSVANGTGIDNSVMVAGYVVMRVAMIAQWLRAAHQDPTRRRSALTYAVAIAAAQVGWVGLLFVRSNLVLVPVAVVVFAIEALGPVFAEKKDGGTPWHAQHIAERYGLLAIIALGEGVVGTIASVSAVVQHQGWSSEAILIVVAGTGLTFGLWWIYFIGPSAEVLSVHRERAIPWAYLHIPLFAAITAVGAGLHLAALVIEHDSTTGSVGAVLIVAIAVLVFIFMILAIYSYLLRAIDPFHILLLAAALLVLGVAVTLAAADVSTGICLVVITLAPIAVVVGYEAFGYRHEEAALAKLRD
jgi:low temperature requirement protein LtrA